MTGLPAGWVAAPIRGLIELNPKNAAAADMDAAFMPMPHLGTDFRHRPTFEVRAWGEIAKSYVHFAEGDVLLAKITPCFENGKAGIPQGLPNGIGAGSSEYFVCRPRPHALSARWLLAYFKTVEFLSNGAQEMTGSVGHKRVPKDFLLDTEIPLPPLAEQQRIADKLDAILARVDACRERLDRVGLLVQRFRQSVLAAAVNGKLSGGADDWSRVRADEVCSKVQSGGTPKSGFATEGVPFLKVYNIVDQQIDFRYRPQYVARAQHDGELSKSKVIPGDVLMNIVGPPLGKVAVVPDEFESWNINQAITLFRPSDRVTTEWLYIVLREGALVREVMPDTKGSVGQVNISLSQCRAFEFPIPPVEEQHAIAAEVRRLMDLADRLEERLRSAERAVGKTSPALLAKAFRGELVPQDPNDEQAAETLARLTARPSSHQGAKRGRRTA